MAEEIACTSVEFEEGGVTSTYTSCWDYSIPDPDWRAADTEGVLPRPLKEGARAWRTCKYFVKGMPAVCGHFNGQNQKCNQPQNAAGTGDAAALPTGYNQGYCDSLGRQTSCNRYTPGSADNLEQYICIMPNMFLSGIGRRVETADPPIVRPIKIDEITGYNDDGQGVGLCDCYGMGRGPAGCSKAGELQAGGGSAAAEVELSKLPVMCNFYRPFTMGFGGIAPHEARKKDGSVDVERLSEMVERDEPLTYRTPFGFEVFNLRARFQKCLWYEAESPGVFSVSTQGQIVLDDDNAFDAQERLIGCKCTDPQSIPFNTRDRVSYDNQFMMANVWAKAGTTVCNGAKPECPCYTGKWYYCTDEKMWAGMPVTAQQIMELRFWSYDWSSQEEYDDYFNERPNPDDTPRPEIYTFTKWNQLSAVDGYSIMEGKKVSMCQPAPLQLKEFIPKEYLDIERITYANFGTDAEKSGQVSFPTLIREPRFPNINPLVVIYPYHCEEAFSEAVCSPNANNTTYRKKTNEVYADSVYVIGQTLPNRQVYVINMTAVSRKPKIIADKINALKMTPEQKAVLAADADNYITYVEESFNQYLSVGFSDSKQGVFTINPVQLKFGDNELLILVDFGGGDFNFKKREVVSLWCGGSAVQTLYDYGTSDNATSETKQPTLIDPPAEIEARVFPLGGSISFDLIPARSYFVPSVWFGDKTYYSYSMYWEEVVDEKATRVCSVGNSTYIWCEIDNLNLNYMFDFEITEAKALFTIKQGTEQEEIITLELEVVDLDYRYIPPNAVLLKLKESNFRFKHNPSNCEVILSYKYQKFAHSAIPAGKTGIFGGGLSDFQVFRDVSFSYELEDTVLKISNVVSETVGFMVFFKDEYGRAVSTVATKFMPYIVRPSCRSIEIRYIYQSDGKQYVLEPEAGVFCVDIAGNRLTGKITPHISDPVCCDHLCSSAGKGPMFFPYSRCEQYDFYNVFAFANFCTAPIDVGPKNKGLICEKCGIGGTARRLDHRYRGPDKYQATAVPRGNWAAACSCGWVYYFSDASTAAVRFTGYGNTKGMVDEAYYLSNGWRMPPFGNDGRELIERYLSQDYIYYYDFQNPQIVHREWAPFVMDNTSFYSQFNAFATYDTTYDMDFSSSLNFPGYDNFKSICQLNLMTHDRTSEAINLDNRKRFDEIFKAHIEGNCTYPPPVLAAGTTTSVTFYQFLEDNMLWAWQEVWREVERNISGETYSERFSFISEYERPPYVWSLFKEEVRLICDEDDHIIFYEGPIIVPDTVGEIETYPSVSLDGAYPKHFEILYGTADGNGVWHYDADNYGDESVDWKIEGAQGKASGSSEQDNAYEDRFGDDWVFSLDERFKNILFDYSEPSDFYHSQDIDGGYVKKKYCTGMMVRIPRSSLIYLPKNKTEEPISIIGESASSDSFNFVVSPQAELDSAQQGIGANTWKGTATFECQEVKNKVISKIIIRGKYGRLFHDVTSTNLYGQTVTTLTQDIYVIPGVTINGTTVDGETNYSPRGLSSSSSIHVMPRERQQQDTMMYNYELVFRFPLSPIEMLKKGYNSFTITLHGGYSSYFINVSEMLIETATYKETSTENIKVWERKYIVSEGNVEWKNVDGPEELLHYKRGGGVHFNYNSYPNQIIKTQNKMRGVFADVPFKGIDQDEPISVTYDNLFSIEVDEQRLLYDKAMALDPDVSSITYRTISPPSLYYFFNFVLRNTSFAGVGSCVFIMTNAEWEKLKLVKDLLQTEYWRTGGHYYKWSDYYEFQSCMVGWHNSMASAIGGGPQGAYATDFERVFYGQFKHVDHTGYGNPLAGAETPVDPGNSYYSLRFYFEKARYERYEQMTGQQPDGGFDLVSRANVYNPSSGS